MQTNYTKLVKTAQVETLSAIKTKQFPGIVEEAEDINLAFRVAGPIKRVFVNEGEYVKKGQLIAELDMRDYLVQKNAIEAQAIQLKSEYSRIEELNKRKSVADNDFEKMKAGKEMIEAKLKNANDQLNDTKLYAPFSGYITKVMFKTGEMVNHGMTVVSMIDVSALKVEINIPASLYIKKDDFTKIECTQDAIPNTTFPLAMYGSNIKANNNGLFKLYMSYKPEQASQLIPGMNVLVHLSYKNNKQDLLKIPVEAVFNKNNESFVWLVKDSTVQACKVITNNLVIQGEIGVAGGLHKGDCVVIGGLQLLHEGEKVSIVKPQSETNIGNIL